MKILIIDDDEVYRKLVKRTLKDCTVLEADSIENGIKILNETKLDCVFLDYRLNGIGGIEFLKQINFKKTYNIPLIMVTDSEYPGLNEEAKALGAISVISKNLLTIELFSMIRNSIRSYKENCYLAGKL